MSESNNLIHTVILENRSSLSLSGVTEVANCTDNSAAVFTSAGIMSIKGNELRLSRYDVESGDLVLTGKINSILYTDSMGKKASTFVGKLFK